jgi:hypothetical protein
MTENKQLFFLWLGVVTLVTGVMIVVFSATPTF